MDSLNKQIIQILSIKNKHMITKFRIIKKLRVIRQRKRKLKLQEI
jgi:hypothetical protein